MARKKNKRTKKPSTSDLALYESNVRKLNSFLVDPHIMGYMRSGMFKGVREKLLKVDYNTVRNVVDKVPLISAVINTRIDQVRPFTTYTPEDDRPGYRFKLRDRTKNADVKNDAMFNQLADFFDQTGIKYDADREDDYADYVDMIVRETMTIDQIATEMQRNMKGEVVAFWLLDASTIRRVDAEEFEGDRGLNAMKVSKDTRFCQMIDGLITNTYTSEDLLFDYKTKRADLRFRGFGYSPVEQCIDLITTLLFGYNYMRDQLMRDRVPKGFIQVMGDVGKPQLDSIRDYWYSAMSGAGGQWNIPILPSGKDGIGLDWKSVQGSNRDLEYSKLMHFLSSTISAVFGMDMAEMGLKGDDSTSLLGENSEPRIQASKSRGLGSTLSYIEQHMNKILRKVNDEYVFEFVGLEREDKKAQAELRKIRVETDTTVNELREEQNKEPIEEDWAKVVLNPQAVQLIQGQQQQDAMQEGGEPGEDDFGEGESGGDDAALLENEQGETGEQEEAEVDWESMFKSLETPANKKKTVKVIIE